MIDVGAALGALTLFVLAALAGGVVWLACCAALALAAWAMGRGRR